MRGVIVTLMFVLAACASSDAAPGQWTKPGTRDGDLALDLYVCDQWSRSAEHLRNCMASHGWKAVAEP